MKKFSCTICFSLNQNLSVLKESLNVFGFTPNVMYVDSEELSADVTYSEDMLISLLNKDFSKIHILNKEYDESEDYYWFRITNHKDYNILQLEWQNINIDFLLNSHSLTMFLSNPNFICGNCCDNGDRFEQSKEEHEYFINTDPKNPYEIEKIVEKYDLSTHWGRSVKTCGLEFMAAPLMWFGEHFYRIIPKQKLLEFSFSSLMNIDDVELVNVKLFDIYDSPSKEHNRKKQKEFWEFFNLENVIAKYKKENEIVDSLEDIIARARKRKKG